VAGPIVAYREGMTSPGDAVDGPPGFISQSSVRATADSPTIRLQAIPQPRDGTTESAAAPAADPTRRLGRAGIARAGVAAPRHGAPASAQGQAPPALEWPVLVVVAVLVALLVRTFVLQSFYIPSGSMFDTLKINNRVVVNKLSYHLHSIHRGDIWCSIGRRTSNITDKDLIKARYRAAR